MAHRSVMHGTTLLCDGFYTLFVLISNGLCWFLHAINHIFSRYQTEHKFHAHKNNDRFLNFFLLGNQRHIWM